MKIKENETYRIMFKERIELDLYVKHEWQKAFFKKLTFKNRDVAEVSIYEIKKETDTVTITWSNPDLHYFGMFAFDIPISSFEILKVRKITWEDVK